MPRKNKCPGWCTPSADITYEFKKIVLHGKWKVGKPLGVNKYLKTIIQS